VELCFWFTGLTSLDPGHLSLDNKMMTNSESHVKDTAESEVPQ